MTRKRRSKTLPLHRSGRVSFVTQSDFHEQLKKRSSPVGVDAHIDPAEQAIFTEVYGKFVTFLGPM